MSRKKRGGDCQRERLLEREGEIVRGRMVDRVNEASGKAKMQSTKPKNCFFVSQMIDKGQNTHVRKISLRFFSSTFFSSSFSSFF